jgi:hypothetical protein
VTIAFPSSIGSIVNPQKNVSVLVENYSNDAIARWNVVNLISNTSNGFSASVELSDGTILEVKKLKGKVIASEE